MQLIPKAPCLGFVADFGLAAFNVHSVVVVRLNYQRIPETDVEACLGQTFDKGIVLTLYV